MNMSRLKPTNANFDRYAEPVLAKWLIDVALKRTDLFYGAAMARLEEEVGFSSIGRATRLGYVAGQIMNHVHEKFPKAPLLNTLLVLQSDRLPSTGAGWFLSKHFGEKKLEQDGAREIYKSLWREYSFRAFEEVYDFKEWPGIYQKVYGHAYRPDESKRSATNPRGGTEKDGIPRGRSGGEGENHKALRLWVDGCPQLVWPKLNVHRSETEFDLPSGDRVDVVYFTSDQTIALEVKSRDSNDVDLERGIYQCVKYRAVMVAMNPMKDAKITAVLVTEQQLPGHLRDLAKQLEIMHKLVPIERNGNA